MNNSMLTLVGTVTNVYEAPRGAKDGREYGGGHKVQLLVRNPLQNGETRMDVITLGTGNPSYFAARINQQVSLPVGAFPVGKNVQFFILKGAQLETLE